jgi:N-methylhydantoinase B
VFEFLTPAQVTINSERRIRAPYGLRGGQAGQVGLNRLIRNGTETCLPGKCSLRVEAGDRIEIETPGGGGWGEP